MLICFLEIVYIKFI